MRCCCSAHRLSPWPVLSEGRQRRRERCGIPRWDRPRGAPGAEQLAERGSSVSDSREYGPAGNQVACELAWKGHVPNTRSLVHEEYVRSSKHDRVEVLGHQTCETHIPQPSRLSLKSSALAAIAHKNRQHRASRQEPRCLNDVAEILFEADVSGVHGKEPIRWPAQPGTGFVAAQR